MASSRPCGPSHSALGAPPHPPELGRAASTALTTRTSRDSRAASILSAPSCWTRGDPRYPVEALGMSLHSL